MTVGQTLYSDISSLVNPIQQDTLAILRQQNLLLPTVRQFNGTGMNPRKGYDWGTLTVNTVAEDDDMIPQKFDKTERVTLTPTSKGAQVWLSDQRLATDWDMIRQDVSMELGAVFATHVDTTLAGHFSSLTGGTVGTAGSALTWNNVLDAQALLQAAGVPTPYFCVLHTYQWLDLYKEIVTNSSGSFQRAPEFQDRLVNNYFSTPMLGGVIFVSTGNVAVDASDDATGAMYSSMAIAYDLRRGFRIAPERDESRGGGGGYELNASLWYASDPWAPARGIQIISDATAPS